MTYSKRTGRDYLDWLGRELTRLENASTQDRAATGDHASTATMIAWHAVERIYGDMSDAMKAEFESATGHAIRTMEQFKEYWRGRMEDMRRVQQTAIETKHVDFDDRYRQFVERLDTTVSASDALPAHPGHRGVGLKFAPKLVIVDTGRRVGTIDLLRETHRELTKFVDEWRIGKNPPEK
jgi:hypothetical protein